MIFITGIAGFIGAALARSLKEKGFSVSGCDNFNDYYSPTLKKLRAKKLQEQGIEVLPLDINDISQIEEKVKNEGITHFIHLAAQAGVRYSLKHPEKYVDANLSGFVQVLEFCKRLMPLKLIFASSSSVYGLTENALLSEEDRTDSPVSLYAATKKANELIAHAYHHLYSIPMIGLRFFTVYGPWGRPDMAYFSFTKSILEGNPIKVFNHGQMQRDFTYIDDIIQGIVSAIEYETSFDIFNLGNNHPVKLMRFIEILEESLGKKAQMLFEPMQPGDVVSNAADISKSQKHLNFQPQTPLEIGIPKFVKWYKEEYALQTV